MSPYNQRHRPPSQAHQGDVVVVVVVVLIDLSITKPERQYWAIVSDPLSFTNNSEIVVPQNIF